MDCDWRGCVTSTGVWVILRFKQEMEDTLVVYAHSDRYSIFGMRENKKSAVSVLRKAERLEYPAAAQVACSV